MTSDYDDDIMGEIRAYREAFAAAHNYDIDAIVATLRAMDAESGQPTISFAPRPVEPIIVEMKPNQET
jgi:hypothetical protein